MDTSASALAFFYGFFWAIGLAGATRYEAFSTASFWVKDQRRRTIPRFLVGLACLTLFPAFWVVILSQCVVPHDIRPCSLLSAAFSSISVFGVVRVFHAFVASDPLFKYFYTQPEIDQVRCRGKFTGSQSQKFSAHFIPGIAYIAGFAYLGYWVGRLH
ncbi:MAG: hypothetical protein WCB10_17830 [Steroidobacteraceae bacterium]